MRLYPLTTDEPVGLGERLEHFGTHTVMWDIPKGMLKGATQGFIPRVRTRWSAPSSGRVIETSRRWYHRLRGGAPEGAAQTLGYGLTYPLGYAARHLVNLGLNYYTFKIGMNLGLVYGMAGQTINMAASAANLARPIIRGLTYKATPAGLAWRATGLLGAVTVGTGFTRAATTAGWDMYDERASTRQRFMDSTYGLTQALDTIGAAGRQRMRAKLDMVGL
jgi:hypothetical protein